MAHYGTTDGMGPRERLPGPGVHPLRLVVGALIVPLAILALFVAVSVFPPERHSDRDALVALYNATDGDNWGVSWNWLGDGNIFRWSGVLSDRRGRVAELHLGDNELSGSIPAELGTLPGLTHLDLSHNELSGPIPPELADLAQLRVLNLRHNQLSGPIPADLRRLTQLTEVYLAGNQLTGCIPAALREVDNDFEQLGLPYCAI